jgi:nitroimidazol reductase NimA-like FMN-containing flavoprotein (pyridoxamine 5'-phosphate oxidase superfamily)
MDDRLTEILGSHRLMAISTLMQDGWPQTTLVGYANEGLLIYFVISREGQKFANIERDQRVAIAIGGDVDDPKQIRELAIAAEASEVTDPEQRERAIDLLLQRRPGLKSLTRPDSARSAVMRAAPRLITLSDYSRGFGHADVVTLGPAGIIDMEPARPDDWGFGAIVRPAS